MGDYWDFNDLDLEPYRQKGADIGPLIDIIGPERKKTKEREFASRTLMALSERYPRVLKDHWGRFSSLLSTHNASSKMPALYVLANLTIAGDTERFKAILPDYVRLLDDEAVGICSHAALNLGKIAKAQEVLRGVITENLLAIREINHNLERVDLISSYVIKAFDQYFEVSNQQDRIIAFVFSLLQSMSPSTQKAAKAFLKAHSVH
jgi:hypothetical protein